MYISTLPILSLSLLLNAALANAQVTAAAPLAPRQTDSDPSLVGYISQSGGYSDARSCSYPQTVSTSGNYVQCCPTSGSCPFFTACNDNSLVAAGTTVDCYVDSALTCNTGIVQATPGANYGASYLACWQKTLGSSAFTFVQNIGSAAPAGTSASSMGATASGSSAVTSSSATMTMTSGASTSATAGAAPSATSSASSTTSNLGNPVAGGLGLGGTVGGFLGLLAQALL